VKFPLASSFATTTGGGSDAPSSDWTRASSAATTRSASSSFPWAMSQRGLSGTLCRMNHTKIAPAAPISTTQRQPSSPNGWRGTSSPAASATTGIVRNCTIALKAKARPRSSFGTSSAMYVSMVTSSTPMPIPATIRQIKMCGAECWKAITTLAAEYHSSEQVKITRRPERSAVKLKSDVPMNNPANVAATKLASPVNPKKDAEVLENIPLRTSPGPM